MSCATCSTQHEKSTSSSILLRALKLQFVFLVQSADDNMDGFGNKTKVIAYLCQHICIVGYCFASPCEKSLTHEKMSAPFAEEKHSFDFFTFLLKELQ